MKETKDLLHEEAPSFLSVELKWKKKPCSRVQKDGCGGWVFRNNENELIRFREKNGKRTMLN